MYIYHNQVVMAYGHMTLNQPSSRADSTGSLFSLSQSVQVSYHSRRVL